jgi:hypothetical protein
MKRLVDCLRGTVGSYESWADPRVNWEAYSPGDALWMESGGAQRRFALELLAEIGAPAVSALIDLLGDTRAVMKHTRDFEGRRVCDYAAEALAAIDTPEARAALALRRQRTAPRVPGKRRASSGLIDFAPGQKKTPEQRGGLESCQRSYRKCHSTRDT